MLDRSGVARLLGSVVLGAAVWLSPPAARAEDAGKAAVLAQAAEARVRQLELRVAIDLYEEAYALSPRPEYLRSIGRLYDGLARAGDSRDVRLAIVYYERSLAEEGQTSEREAVEACLVRLRGWKARMRPEPQPPPVPATVPLHLLSYKADATYDVESGSTACKTPCTLLMPPGPTILKANGAGKVDLQFVVPPRPSQIRLQHTDSDAFVAGAIMVPVGLVVGGVMWTISFACGFDDGGCQAGNLIAWPVLGVSTFIAGVVLLARGRITPPADANRVELVGRAPAVQLLGNARGLGFTF